MKAWEKIRQLIATNALHRKGFRLQDVSEGWILQHAFEELKELFDGPDDASELADLFGCLIHYAIKKGWTSELLDELLLKKLAERFTVPSPEKPVLDLEAIEKDLDDREWYSALVNQRNAIEEGYRFLAVTLRALRRTDRIAKRTPWWNFVGHVRLTYFYDKLLKRRRLCESKIWSLKSD